jgi:hypothetical protein
VDLNIKKFYLKTVEPDRNYYIKNFGFDPHSEIKEKMNSLMYSREFQLVSDKKLRESGIKMYAQVTFTHVACLFEKPFEFYSPRFELNQFHAIRLVFVKDLKKGFVNCIHTGVSVDMEEYDKLLEKDFMDFSFWARSRQVHLSNEEHFVALCSFTAGIVETGIENLLRMSYEEGMVNFPVGFNGQMHGQIIRAIIKVDNDQGLRIVRDLLIDISRVLTTEEMDAFFHKFSEMYDFRELSRNVNTLQLLLDLFPRYHDKIIEMSKEKIALD